MAADGGASGALVGAIGVVIAAYVAGRYTRAGNKEATLATLPRQIVEMSGEIRTLQDELETALQAHRECERRLSQVDARTARQDEVIEKLGVKVERLEEEQRRRREN